MTPAAVPHKTFDRLALALVVLVLAAPLTYLEVAKPSLGQITDAISGLSRDNVATQAPAKPAAPAVKPAAPKPVAKTAMTNTFVHMRAGKSVSTAIVTNLESGTTVQLRDDSDATWQGVTYKGKNGYIYRSYLQF